MAIYAAGNHTISFIVERDLVEIAFCTMAKLISFLRYSILLMNVAKRATIDNNTETPSFVCVSGDRLADIQMVCDGRIDCYDGSDERAALCAHTVCAASKFKCIYGGCINREKKCDGIGDCHDASDEQNCDAEVNRCAPNEFMFGRMLRGSTALPDCIRAIAICDGITDCANGSDESKMLCINRNPCPNGTFRCRNGGCVSGNVQCDGFRDCLDGSDEDIETCPTHEYRRSMRCPPIIGPTVTATQIQATCTFNGVDVPCTHLMEPGTWVTYDCGVYWRPVNERHANNKWNRCQDTGVWLRDVLRCEPVCGRLTTHGWAASNTPPWHARLVRNHDVDSQAEPQYICGATLISKLVVITAAHCLWNTKPQQNSVIVGSVRYRAQSLIPHPLYFDKFGNYGSDIALIELDSCVQFNAYVRPICIDWTMEDIAMHTQYLGISIGHGNTEQLQTLRMPVVSAEKCRDKMSIDFIKYITFTTFCGGWTNGSSLCNGDSGAGFYYPMDKSPELWHLIGIVSLSPRKVSTASCDPQQYTIFTKVSIYAKWIERVMAAVHQRRAGQLDLASRHSDIF